MAGEWREVTVADIAAGTRNALVGGPFGSDLVSADYVVEGVPVIRGQNMGGRWLSGNFAFVSDAKARSLEANIARPGDIIFTQRGTLGQVSLVPDGLFDRYLVSQSQMKLTVNREIADPYFFYYLFTSAEQQAYIRQRAIQTGVPHTNLRILRTTPTPLPPLPEQRAIAHILGTLDDRIEANRRMAATLEAMARALFRAWFVTFEPVRAKAEGRWRPGQTLPGLPASLYDTFPDRLVETEHGEIPEGWAFVSVGELADIKGGKQLDKENFQDAGPFPVFGGAGLMGYTAAHNADGYVITLGRVGAYCGRFFAHRGKAWVNNNASIVAQTHDVPGEWLFLALQCLDIEKIKKGAAQPFVANSDLAAMAIVKPAPKLLNAFQKLATPAVCRSEVANAEAACLSSIRDALLPKLVSGAIRVKDAEAFLKARGL